MSTDLLLFQSQSSATSGVSDFVNQEFQDLSLPSSANTGFSSTVSTNPFGNFYSNDDVLRYRTKTLWVKDMVLIQDSSKWINRQPTYQIIWNQTFPPIQGYCSGGASIQRTQSGARILLQEPGDSFGVGGIFSNVMWIVAGEATGNLSLATSTDAIVGTPLAIAANQPYAGSVKYSGYLHQASNASRNIHDFRLSVPTGAIQGGADILGCIIFYSNAGNNPEVFPGNTYISKNRTSTSVGASFQAPTSFTSRGGKSCVYKNSNASYGITTTPIPDILTNATGSANTNLLTVNTNQGASFPIGTGIFAAMGTSIYYGVVTNRASDTLTVGPTLPNYGTSALLFQLWQAGSGYSLASGYSLSFQYQPWSQGGTFFGGAGAGGVVAPSASRFVFQEPTTLYRVFGGTASILSGTSLSPGMGQTYGLQIAGAGQFLQIDGQFEALEFEFMAGQSAVLQATLSIDGIVVPGYNEVVSTSVFRRNAFIGGANGMHSVLLQAGAGMTQILISKILGYSYQNPGQPVPLSAPIALGNLNAGSTFLARSAVNATLIAIGPVKRLYADQLETGASWILSGVTSGIAGGYFLQNSTTGGAVALQYYGTQFAVAGSAGSSLTFTVDGVGYTGIFGRWIGSTFTEGFHNVSINHFNGTSRIDAVDILKPSPEPSTLQNFVPNSGYDKLVSYYQQSQEPLQAKNGDIWEHSGKTAEAYEKLFNIWVPKTGLVPVCSYQPDSQQTVTTSGAVILFQTKLFDYFNVMVQGASQGVIVPSTGKYMISSQVTWTSSPASARSIQILKNGAAYKAAQVVQPATVAADFSIPINAVVDATAGDLLQIFSSQSSGGNLNTSISLVFSWFDLFKMGYL